MRRRTSLLPLAAFGLLIATSACKSGSDANSAAPLANQADEPKAGEVELRVVTAAGKSHSFTVELAIDPQSQEHGLMERKTMADNHGMIFPFPYPQTASFWMKNTPMPLDLMFIRPDGTIAAMLQGKPEDLHPLSAGEGISAVLEIRQGRSDALGIQAGDHVQWGDCTTPEPAANAWRADRFCPANPAAAPK